MSFSEKIIKVVEFLGKTHHKIMKDGVKSIDRKLTERERELSRISKNYDNYNDEQKKKIDEWRYDVEEKREKLERKRKSRRS